MQRFRFALILISLVSFTFVNAQVFDDGQAFFSRLQAGTVWPEKIIESRSVVYYSYTLTELELGKIQATCQKSGIDPVVYFETDEIFAGKDPAIGMARYLIKREVSFMIFIVKNEKGYEAYITPFNAKETFADDKQVAWYASDPSLGELLLKIYRAAGGGMKRSNMLINDVPETEGEITVIDGRRSDFFAIDLRVDELAVPKTGDPIKDKALEEVFSTYPFKYKLTEPGISEQTLRKNGSTYVLCFVHTRGSIAKKLLGYDMSKVESAIASIAYPDGAALPQFKNIPSETPVYKFYFKHIDSGNVFLGTKWDADVTFDLGLKNQYRAFKAEFKIP